MSGTYDESAKLGAKSSDAGLPSAAAGKGAEVAPDAGAADAQKTAYGPAAQLYDAYVGMVQSYSYSLDESVNNVNIIGIRGWLNGAAVPNVKNQFNDTIVCVWKTMKDGVEEKHCEEFIASVDPGTFSKWYDSRGDANLMEGQYGYQMGTHNGYAALNPTTQSHVWRDGKNAERTDNAIEEWNQWLGINIHAAGDKSWGVDNWSAGCQVIASEDGTKGENNTAFKHFRDDILRKDADLQYTYTLIKGSDFKDTDLSALSAANKGLPKAKASAADKISVSGATSYNNNNALDIVIDIQRFLKVPETGVFDAATCMAIAEWQEENGLTVDGKFGPTSRSIATSQGLGTIPSAPAEEEAVEEEAVEEVEEVVEEEATTETETPEEEREEIVEETLEAVETGKEEAGPVAEEETVASGVPSNLVELRRGSKDVARVLELQRRLVDLGFSTNGLDGDYGGGTEGAVSAFQAKYGLPVTGIADIATLTKLYELVPNPSIGALSAKYESRGGNDTIGYDTSGGTSYGKYQIASKVGAMDEFVRFLNGHGYAHLGAILSAAKPYNTGSKYGACPDAWRAHADELAQPSEEFIVNNYFTNGLGASRHASLQEFIEESPTLRDVYLSASVNHGAGGANSIINGFYYEGISKREFITKMYAGRKTYTSGSSYRDALWNRYDEECQIALAMLDLEEAGGTVSSGAISSSPSVEEPAAEEPVAEEPAVEPVVDEETGEVDAPAVEEAGPVAEVAVRDAINVDSAVKFNNTYNKAIAREIQEFVGADVDGIFGPNTVNKIADWQFSVNVTAKSEVLDVDGKFGNCSKEEAKKQGFMGAKPEVPVAVPAADETTSPAEPEVAPTVTVPEVAPAEPEPVATPEPVEEASVPAVRGAINVDSAVKFNNTYNKPIAREIQAFVGTAVDGIFGPNTVNKIADWQFSINVAAKADVLDVDGKFGECSKEEAKKHGFMGAKTPEPTPETSAGSSPEVAPSEPVATVPAEVPDGNITAHFTWAEFACKDAACTPVPERLREGTRRLCRNLEVLREELGGKSISINSGYRTESHNAAVGGASASRHKEGDAADFVVSGYSAPTVRAKILELIAQGKMEDGGLGDYPSWVHYDVRGYQARWNGS